MRLPNVLMYYQRVSAGEGKPRCFLPGQNRHHLQQRDFTEPFYYDKNMLSCPYHPSSAHDNTFTSEHPGSHAPISDHGLLSLLLPSTRRNNNVLFDFQALHNKAPSFFLIC